jgi:hypothetical protein
MVATSLFIRNSSCKGEILKSEMACQNPEKIEENIEQVKTVILSNEGKEKPVWITEFGLPTGANKDGRFVYSEENQASVLTRYLALMFVNGIEKALIFNLKIMIYDKGRSIKIKRINGIFETYMSKL